jgi:DUF971 family protein
MTAPPDEIHYDRATRVLRVSFPGGVVFDLPAEFLRVESPSAEVQGHNPGQKQILGGKRDVTITAIEPVGQYAVRLIFDDGHDTGIYSWDYLAEAGRDRERLWATYLSALKSRGLRREP